MMGKGGGFLYRVFVVEDDPSLVSLLCGHLKSWGFEAVAGRDFSNVVGEFEAARPHLVIMDVSLPGHNGFYWCGEIRRVSRVPVLFLSSHAESMDVLTGVNMGADDYVTKPFSMEVLVAKMNALLRRAYEYGREETFSVRGATLNPADATLRWTEGEAELTRNESRILRTLMERKNQIVSREELMKALWDSDSFVDDNTLTVNINRLRRKLEEAGLKEFIQTKKGLGYMVHD